MCRHSEHIEAILAVVTSAGASADIEVRGRRHPRIVVTHGDRTHVIVCPKSPSDWRGVANAVSFARRLLGISASRPKSSSPSRRRLPHRDRPISVPEFDERREQADHWLGPLEELQRRMARASISSTSNTIA